jgi:hypothetical protein
MFFVLKQILPIVQNTHMQIEIDNALHQKDWLLTSPKGQFELARAKDLSFRPLCTCNTLKPEMYVAHRGELYYLARMPGSSKLHAPDCQSHIVPATIYKNSVNAPSEILAKLWQLVNSDLQDQERNWGGLRESVLRTASKVMVDGIPLSSTLLIPEQFDRQHADDQKLSYTDFYQKCDDDDGAIRYWTLGIIKELKPAKFSTHLIVRHMPGLSFWVNNEKAALLPPVEENGTQLALFVCRPVRSGIAVSDIASIELNNKFQSIITPSNEITSVSSSVVPPQTLSEEEKFTEIRHILNLPSNTPHREVITQLIDHFLQLHRDRL